MSAFLVSIGSRSKGNVVHGQSQIVNYQGYLPFNQVGGALLFHLLSKLHDRTTVVITTNSGLTEWAQLFGDVQMTIVVS